MIDITSDMSSKRHHIPSSSALVAFESAGRLQAIGRAAEELNTSQSAISRHIRHLEEHLGLQLFDRTGRGVALTPSGETYLATVTSALDMLSATGKELRLAAHDVTIACTHEVSHLLLMPEYTRLRRVLGRHANIRFLTCEYELVPEMVHAGADLTFEYATSPVEGRAVRVLDEQIIPVASPAFLAAHEDILSRDPSTWRTIPLLALSKNNFGWAKWQDWFAAVGADMPAPPADTFDNYVYLLEAARSGAGLALGWKGFVDRYLEMGTLAAIPRPWLRREPKLIARLTRKGTNNRNAEKCLTFLSGLFS